MVVNEMNPHTTKFMLFCFYILILSLNYRYFNFNLNSVKHLEFSSLMLLTCFNEKTRFLGTLETLKYQTTFPLVLRVEFSNRQLIIPYQPRHIISTEIIYLFDMIRSIKYQIKAYHIQCVLSFYTNFLIKIFYRILGVLKGIFIFSMKSPTIAILTLL